MLTLVNLNFTDQMNQQGSTWLRRWQCIGHVLRKGNEENQKIALTWAPEGKCRRGRPRETWKWTAERERNQFGWPSSKTSKEEARYRTRWRGLCLALYST
jgi:hypothetical protein